MAQLEQIPSARYPPGTRPSPGSVILAPGVQGVSIVLTREAWAPGPRHAISLQTEVSADGGVTWEAGGGFTSDGGVIPTSLGPPLTETRVAFGVQRPELTRLLRWTFRTDIPIDTSITVASIPWPDRPPVSEHHSIAFEGGDSVSGSGVGSLTIPTFATVGTGRLIFCGNGANNDAGGGSTTSVVRGGAETFTEQWDAAHNTDYNHSGSTFLSPALASATILVTFGGTYAGCAAMAIALSGVDLGTPFGTPVTASGSSASASVTATANLVGDWICDHAMFANATTIAADAGQTMRFEQENVSGTHVTSYGISTQLGSDGGVMSWSAASNPWAIGALPVHAAETLLTRRVGGPQRRRSAFIPPLGE